MAILGPAAKINSCQYFWHNIIIRYAMIPSGRVVDVDCVKCEPPETLKVWMSSIVSVHWHVVQSSSSSACINERGI